jgi:hypothetical protein
MSVRDGQARAAELTLAYPATSAILRGGEPPGPDSSGVIRHIGASDVDPTATDSETFAASANHMHQNCAFGSSYLAHVDPYGVVETAMRSPGRPKMLRISAGSSPVLPNQCGTVVSNAATSPGPSTLSWSPSTNRSRPDST